MNSRSIFGALAALMLLGLLCVCGLGAFVLINRSELAALPGSLEGQMQTVGTATPVALGAQPTPVGASAQPQALPSDALAIVRAEEAVLNQVYETIAPSVVNISISGASNSLIGELGEGSGWLWDLEGHIVTNNHVVANAQTVIVTFSDGTESRAEVVGTDPDSDLAVIRVESLPDGLMPLAPGISSELRVGQRVIAIGNPFGFEGTLTLGVVSATERTVPGVVTESGDQFSLPNLIQTDAAINPGNSGGPLLDIEGRVVGVNSLIYSENARSNSGVGFAVPVDKVKAVVPALISDGVFETPFLGVRSLPIPLTPELAGVLGLQNVVAGVLVQSVEPGGPADQAGVRGGTQEVLVEQLGGPVVTGGDVIVAIDDRAVREFDDLINYLDTRTVGDVVTLTVIREGAEQQFQVTLGARPN